MTLKPHYLNFPDEQTATQKLVEAIDIMAMDVIGLNPKQLDASQGYYTQDGMPIWKTHAGFLVNVLSMDELPQVLQEYEVFPTTPMRVFAGTSGA